VPEEARYRATGGALARFHGACQRDLDRKRPTGITRSATVASRTKAPLDPTEVGPASRKPGVSNPSIRARALADPGDMLPCEKRGSTNLKSVCFDTVEAHARLGLTPMTSLVAAAL
jgi:hypothetical protein